MVSGMLRPLPLSPFSIVVAGALACYALPAFAQESEPPYWASIRADVVNLRVGPSVNYRIAWIYRRHDLPLKVVRKKDGWRLVQDPDGEQGWVVARFLSRDRTAIVKGHEKTAMRDRPTEGGRLNWKLAPGVVGKLGSCESGWCQFDVQGRKGWVRDEALWGVSEP